MSMNRTGNGLPRVGRVGRLAIFGRILAFSLIVGVWCGAAAAQSDYSGQKPKSLDQLLGGQGSGGYLEPETAPATPTAKDAGQSTAKTAAPQAALPAKPTATVVSPAVKYAFMGMLFGGGLLIVIASVLLLRSWFRSSDAKDDLPPMELGYRRS